MKNQLQPTDIQYFSEDSWFDKQIKKIYDVYDEYIIGIKTVISSDEYKLRHKNVLERYENVLEEHKNNKYFDPDNCLNRTICTLKFIEYPKYFKKMHERRMYPLIKNAERLLDIYEKHQIKSIDNKEEIIFQRIS